MSTTSTPMASPGADQFFAHGSAEPKRPQLACTLVITGIGDAKLTSAGIYTMADVITEPTRGSQKAFPSIMFRPEMFSPGFDPINYTDYVKYPNLSVVPEGKKGTLGSSLASVANIHVVPTLPRDKDGNPIVRKDKAGNVLEPKCNTLMAICGGSFYNGIKKELAPRLAAAFASIPADRNPRELTADEIVSVLREQLKAQGRVELGVTMRQSRDQSGSLSDRYEISSWDGPFTRELNEYYKKRAEKQAGNSDVSKRLSIRYSM